MMAEKWFRDRILLISNKKQRKIEDSIWTNDFKSDLIGERD